MNKDSMAQIFLVFYFLNKLIKRNYFEKMQIIKKKLLLLLFTRDCANAVPGVALMSLTEFQ